MRIALIQPGALPSRTANSIQRMKMAQAMAAIGHDVRVFVAGRDPGLHWDELARHYGLQHRFELEWVPSLPVLRRYDFALRAVGRARAWAADLLYSRLPQASAWAATRGLRTLFEVHEAPTGVMGPWLMRHYLRAPAAWRLVTITRALADKIAAEYRLPARADFLQVAPSGVDMQRYENLPAPAAARQSLGLVEGFTVGYTGHLYAGRGLDLMLELAAILPEMHFLLVGGNETDLARARQRAAGLSNLTLTGFVPNTDLPRYQAAADVLLMPYGPLVSGSSGGDIAPYFSPMKMFEYLAAGRAVVASDLSVLREVLTGENAVSLPGGDADAWAAVLRSLAAEPARREALGAAARRTARQYTWERRAERMLAGLS